MQRHNVYSTVTWWDSNTCRLISPETPVIVKERPEINVEQIPIFTGREAFWLEGKKDWQEMTITYLKENLGAVLFLKHLKENCLADASVKSYETINDKIQFIDEWYLEKCIVSSYYMTNPNFSDAELQVNFKYQNANYF